MRMLCVPTALAWSATGMATSGTGHATLPSRGAVSEAVSKSSSHRVTVSVSSEMAKQVKHRFDQKQLTLH